MKSVWRDSLAPPIKHRVTPPVYDAINFSVEKILHDGSTGLIALASVLALWNLAVGMRTIMQALNTIHETEETRSLLHRAALSLALAVVVGVCLLASVLVVTVAPRIADGGLGVLVGIGRWLVAAALLGAAVGMLLRYAPAERPEVGWESVGSVLVIVSWVVASLLFRVWATSVADFKTAVGSLTVFLVLTAYIFTSSAIFLVGVELDEVLRQESGGKPRGFAQLVRELLAPGPAANG